jgi:hypothetical protein
MLTSTLPDKKQREQEQAKRDASDRDITEYFTRGAAKPQQKPKVSTLAAFLTIGSTLTFRSP